MQNYNIFQSVLEIYMNDMHKYTPLKFPFFADTVRNDNVKAIN